MKKKKVFLVCGARPNFIKISALWNEIKKHAEFKTLIVHTGQHYDHEMAKIFFQELKIPKPDFYLGASRLSRPERMAKIITSFESLCKREKPGLVVVVGDVDSTLACALAAWHLSIPLAHVEAGLRSFDKNMPEEINRIITDHLSDFLFTSCALASRNLKQEGITEKKIFFVGNIMIDTLLRHKTIAASLSIYKRFGCNRRDYALLTLHRPETVDCAKRLKQITIIMNKISERIPIVFPCHPRTATQLKKFKINIADTIEIIPSLGYLEFFNLMLNSKFVLTDSGGIQEETTALKVPCLTLRNNTERPVTVSAGTNIIVGLKQKVIMQETSNILRGKIKEAKTPRLWDGKTSQRIVKTLENKL